MYVDQLNLIFVHYPKTGGNSISTLLLQHSQEAKQLSGHQDGRDRFEIRGEYTKSKHQRLTEYLDFQELSNAKIFTSLRHRVERMVSWYFSPHRWMRVDPTISSASHPQFKQIEASFDEADFENLVQNEFLPQTHWFQHGAKVIQPHHIVDFSDFTASLKKFCDTAGIVTPSVPVLNKSSKNAEQIKSIASNPDIIRIVQNSAHAADWENFPQMDWSWS